MMSSKERRIMTNNKQLELGFNGLPPRTRTARREGRITRANWWFAQMRQTVASAMDWQTVNEPRPQQVWMPGVNRQVKI
jgi:hypothetical protein